MHSELERNIGFCDKKIEIPTSWTDPLLQLNGFVTNSFCDLTPPNESHGRKKRTQNTFSPNELTDFDQFTVEHPARPKTILPSISAQRPGTGITLQLSALRITCMRAVNRSTQVPARGACRDGCQKQSDQTRCQQHAEFESDNGNIVGKR